MSCDWCISFHTTPLTNHHTDQGITTFVWICYHHLTWRWIPLRMLKWKSFSGPLFHQDNKITSRYAMITWIIAYHSTHVWLLLLTKIRTNVSRCLICPFHQQVQPGHALLQAKTLKLIYLNLIFSKHFYYTMGNILLTNTQRELNNKI